MKTRYMLIGMAAAAMLTGCNQTNNPTADTSTNVVDNVKAEVNQERDKFIAEMDKQRTDFDAKINELATKSADFQGDAKADADKTLASLRQQRDALNKEFDELKSSTGDAWDKTKAAFQSGWDDMEAAYDKAKFNATTSNPGTNASN
jgi:uncharacterized coiled-coil DUF342 family protein